MCKTQFGHVWYSVQQQKESNLLNLNDFFKADILLKFQRILNPILCTLSFLPTNHHGD